MIIILANLVGGKFQNRDMSLKQHYNTIAKSYELLHPLRLEAVDKICNFIKEQNITGKIVDF